MSVRHLLGLGVAWHVLALALFLLACGLVFIQGMEDADLTFGRAGVDFGNHVKKVVLTLPALAVGMLVRPRWLRRNSWILYVLSIVLLLLVPVIGEERNNARRWIPLPVGFDLQPSELAKLGLILALAAALYRSRMKTWGEWALPSLIALLPMGLVVLQPDLGTAMTIVPVALGMFHLAGARTPRIVAIVGAGVLAAFLAWQLELVRPYQVQRIDTWLTAMDRDA